MAALGGGVFPVSEVPLYCLLRFHVVFTSELLETIRCSPLCETVVLRVVHLRWSTCHATSGRGG